jgi:VanZ family protein
MRVDPRSWRSILINWLPVLLWMALIFFLSSQTKAKMPHHPIDLVDWPLKKMAHMLEYAVLAVLVWRAISNSAGANTKRAQVWLIPLLCLAYAATDEYHQAFVSGRSSSALDVLIDALGVTLALVATSFVIRWRANRPSRTFVHPWLDRFFDGFLPLRPVAQEDVSE